MQVPPRSCSDAKPAQFTDRFPMWLLALLAAVPLLLAGCGGGSGGSGTTPPEPVTIANSSLPAATVGVAYSTALSASGGTAPYTFAVTSGTLPGGLSLSSAGVLSGTPAAAATVTLGFTATDARGADGSASLSLVVNAAPLVLTTTTLPSGTAGLAYSATLAASGGVTPYTYAVATGTLPPGITLSSAGVLSGTPTAPGTSSLGITVTDSAAHTASGTLALAIDAAPIVLATTTLPAGTVGAAYSATLAASGGVPPYTYAVATGTLPAGIALSSAGVLSGTPTAPGTSSLGITVTDSAAHTASGTLALVVNPAPLAITSPSVFNEQEGVAFSTALSASGGTKPYLFTLGSGTLPPGVVLGSGTLSGTPTATGAYPVTLMVTDSSSPALTATEAVTINVYTAMVQVATGTVLATVPATAYGLHTSVYDSGLDDATGLAPALETDGIGVLRYPGGLYSDNYHWAQRSLTPFTPPIAAAACNNTSGSPVTNGYLAPNTDFGHFAGVLAATATQGLITVNYGTSVADSTASTTAGTYGVTCSVPNTSGQPEEAAAWVAYANGSPTSTQAIGTDAVGFNWQTVGYWASLRAATPLAVDDGYNFLRIGQTAPIGVTYWELGNELFYNGYPNDNNSETDLHAPYVYPNGYTASGDTFSSRIGVSALSPSSYGTNVIPYIAAMKAVDPSIKIGLVLSSPNVDPIPANWNPAAIQAVCAGTTFDFGIFHYYPGTYEAVTSAQLVSDPQSQIPALAATAKQQIAQYCPSTASPVEFFMTETGVNGALASSTPVSMVGLFATDTYLTALSSGFSNVDYLEMHNNANYLTYTAPSTETPGAAYWGVELAHLLAGVGDSLVSTTSSTSQVVAFGSVKAAGGEGVTLINANATAPETVLVTVSGASLSGTVTQYSYGVNSNVTAQALPSTTFSIAGNSFLVTVPAYTATTLILP